MAKFRITREIGIDAGHRVPNHHSRCKNIHGHRYTIQATVEGELAESGSVEGMAGGMDFGFIKEEMMKEIDEPCDHKLILWKGETKNSTFEDLADIVAIYWVDFSPTAENLAEHWFRRVDRQITLRSKGHASLVKLRVYETPNCWADYEPGEK